MQFFLEHVAVSVAAITGVLAARGKHVDLFAVMVLALVTAFGGGTIRDLLLGARPVFWITGPDFLVNVVVTAFVVFFLVRYRELPRTALLVADAFGLALFTMVGVRKGLVFEAHPLIAIAMGVITGVAGGILRDLLIGEIPLVFRRETYLYATAAIAGSAVCVMIILWAERPALAVSSGMLVTLGMRLAGIKWRIALPEFRPLD